MDSEKAMTNEKKSATFQMRVTPRELRLMKNAAKLRGTSVSEMVRETMIPKSRKVVLAQEDEIA